MFAAVFSFRGRVGRRGYILGSLALGVVLMLLGMMLIGFVELPPTARPSPAMSMEAALLVVLAPLAVWSALSLQARRMRDIGWEPMIGLPMWIASVGLAQNQPMLAFAFCVTMLACLLAWPGRRDGRRASSAGGGRGIALSPAYAPARRRPASAPRRGR